MRRSRAAWLRGLVACAALCVAVSPAVWAAGADEVVVAFATEPNRVDPTRSIGGLNERFITLFYEQLLNVDPDRNRVNWLAESWSFERKGPVPSCR